MSAEQTPSPHENTDWRPCQPGELSALVQRVCRARQRDLRRRLAVAVTTAASLLLLVGWMWQAAVPPQQQAQQLLPEQQQRISCREVLALGDQYVRHELDDELQARIAAHLHACPRCEIHLQNLARDLETSVSDLSRNLWQHLASR